jgi:hypothetical protein
VIVLGIGSRRRAHAHAGLIKALVEGEDISCDGLFNIDLVNCIPFLGIGSRKKRRKMECDHLMTKKIEKRELDVQIRARG